MKKTPDIRKQYEDLAPCDNDRCLARHECLRFIKFENERTMWGANFAPKSADAQHCRCFRRVKR